MSETRLETRLETQLETQPGFLLGTAELTDANVERIAHLLDRLRADPGLAGRYAGTGPVTSLSELAGVPVMRKDDLQAALAAHPPKAAAAATWIFQSGGSTGSPQVGYAPTGLYMREVYENWPALGPDDVFVNGWSAGKMWGAHFLVNAYADHAGCTAMNVGAMTKDEYSAWLEFFAKRRVTAFGGTPSVLRLVFGHAREAGIKLPDLRAVLFLGEAWDPRIDDDLAVVAPGARRWGMFGSTETWVVATNTPECAYDTWHPLPSQLVHVGSAGQDGSVEEEQFLDFTTLNPEGLNPILRYQTGDAGEITACPCGDPRPALKILGRRDGLIKFRGHLVNVADTLAEVGGVPGVAKAQLVVHEYADGNAVLEVLALPSGAATEGLAERVRDRIAGAGFGPSIVFQRNPHALRVTVVDALLGNERTGKIPNLVTRRES
ncbi:AMP-binding protein [Hamadaea tsunoensis]|uniref:AMP-binding protein n=1 Tax=Hamadaea tsunoensis TaxID=53368 RepID=UPI00040CF989|nr:AMP-binding protein [Hamadaea tsunoensis]